MLNHSFISPAGIDPRFDMDHTDDHDGRPQRGANGSNASERGIGTHYQRLKRNPGSRGTAGSLSLRKAAGKRAGAAVESATCYRARKDRRHQWATSRTTVRPGPGIQAEGTCENHQTLRWLDAVDIRREKAGTRPAWTFQCMGIRTACAPCLPSCRRIRLPSHPPAPRSAPPRPACRHS
jgi:hypothetical protein